MVGLLDELEDEAQRRKSGDEDAAALKLARESAYRTVLEPAMASLFAYLSELIAKLKPCSRKSPSSMLLRDTATWSGTWNMTTNCMKPGSRHQKRSRCLFLPRSPVPLECPNVHGGIQPSPRLSALFQRHRFGAPLAPTKDASGEVVGATFKAMAGFR